PLIAFELTDLWTKWMHKQGKKSVARVLDDVASQLQDKWQANSLWLPAGIAALCLSGSASTWPQDMIKELYPGAIVAKYKDRIATSRVLTTDKWGGYLVFHNYPRQRLFFDGRHNYYGDKLIGDYQKLTGGHYTWRKLMEQYRFELVLLSVDTPLASLIKEDRGWRILEDDGKTILFERVL
ncbi:MAG: hypothetical protein ABIZ80_14530, partial [Bryobacteraceae bacterium]